MTRTAIMTASLIGFAVLPVSLHAQDHSQHQEHTAPTPTVSADPHAGHTQAPVNPAPALNHDMMDHSNMDHGASSASQDALATSPGPMMETPTPAEAGSGPPRAADAIWGAEAMASSRKYLREMHGDFPVFWFQGDRLEVQSRAGDDSYLWDVQGYYGGPTRRLWFKSEGEGAFGERIDDAEVQALYSQAISPYWDLQVGARQDVAGVETTHAVIGIQGLVPYLFEIDAAMFVSHRGDITARVEAELDQRITRRLILQPRAQVNMSAQNMPRLGIGSGIDAVEVGVRLRYEFIREFAPYIGVEQSWRIGRGADFARAAGEDSSVTNYVIGVRFWF